MRFEEALQLASAGTEDALVLRRMAWTPGDPPEILVSREWLVTNGLGGYAAGTVAGVPTRRYHGFLVAALPSPLGRTMMLQCLSEDARLPSGEVVHLFGGEEVFSAASQLVNNPRSEQALTNLQSVYDMLKVYGLESFVLLDLSEIRGFDYYTGIVFEGFTANLGYEICGGGRYDHLIGRFGEESLRRGVAAP